MFNKDSYVIYETNDNHVLLYDKYTKRMTTLAKEQYQLLVQYTEGKTTDLCPRSLVDLALIMLGRKTQPIVQIGVIENDVAMNMVFVGMYG